MIDTTKVDEFHREIARLYDNSLVRKAAKISREEMTVAVAQVLNTCAVAGTMPSVTDEEVAQLTTAETVHVMTLLQLTVDRLISGIAIMMTVIARVDPELGREAIKAAPAELLASISRAPVQTGPLQ